MSELNWLALVVVLGLGILLGWLITGLPARRKLAQAETDAGGLDAKLQQTNSDLSASQQHERELQGNLDAANAALAASQQRERDLQSKIETANADVAASKQQADALQNTLGMRDGELTELKLRYSALRTAAQQTYGDANSQLEGLNSQVKSLSEENSNLKTNLEGIFADLAKARAEAESTRQALANKDTALTEAYARAVRLEHETTDEQSRLVSFQSEIATLKREKATLSAANHDMQVRLENARGEVANELAVLTSTMLRVKDDQLVQANATIAALQAQLAQATAAPVTSK